MVLRQEIGHFFSAIRNSFDGIKYILKETAFRQEVFFGIVHYAFVVYLDIPFTNKLILSVLPPLVWSVELINSAVEQVVDHISPEWNEFVKRAKDMCSAAVGVLILTTLCVWAAVIWKKFI